MSNATSISATCGSCGVALITEDLLETDVLSCTSCGSTVRLAEAADIEARTSRQAVFSLLLGLASIIGLFLTGIPAIVFGVRSLRLIRREPAHYKGRGLAIAGIVTGSGFGVIFGACMTMVSIIAVPMISGINQKAVCKDHLAEIGFAMELYEDANGSLPPAASRDKDGRPLLSWRVLILPYFPAHPELKKLHAQFHLDEPWDSVHNRQLAAAIPEIYRCETDPGTDHTLTHYAAITGPGTVFDNQSTKTWKTGDEELLWTVLVGEVTSEQKITWTEPRDISISDYSENSGWLDGGRLGSFDSHHEVMAGFPKEVHLLRVIQDYGEGGITQSLNSNDETVEPNESGGHFHFRRRLFVGGHSLKHLTMTEIEVFSGGENVALQGTATQSSTLDGAVAGRAIDGKTDKGNHAYSRTTLEPNPWWELKLKEPVPIDGVVIHNMSEWDPAVKWILTIQLLDANRKVEWEGTLDRTISFGGSMNIVRTRDGVLTVGEVSSEDSDSDTAEPPKPTVAQFLRMELTTTDDTAKAGPPAVENPTPPDDTPVTSPGPTPTPDTP
jgi:hypothetical protein